MNIKKRVRTPRSYEIETKRRSDPFVHTIIHKVLDVLEFTHTSEFVWLGERTLSDL